MAALTGITAVRPTATTNFERVVYGATVAVGQPLYLDPADNEYKLADADAVATAAAVGIAMTPGVDGGYGIIAKSGAIILVGTTMAKGINYFVGTTPGEIVLEGDLATGDFITRLGAAASTTQLQLAIDRTGIDKA
jgi:hypothetical protein